VGGVVLAWLSPHPRPALFSESPHPKAIHYTKKFAYIIGTENGYEFSSKERRVICFLVHLQEDYETFHPLT
jgi:hypothetical protein